MNTFSYQISVSKPTTLSLPDFYRVHIPSQSVLSAIITSQSIRDFLLLLALLMNSDISFTCSFVPCSDLPLVQSIFNTSELINGSEHNIELFIYSTFGFFSHELSIPDWITLISSLLSTTNSPV